MLGLKSLVIFAGTARRFRTLTRNRRLCKSNPSLFFLQTSQTVRCVATIKSHSKSNSGFHEKTTNYKSCSVTPHQELAISKTHQLVGAKNGMPEAVNPTFKETCKAQLFFLTDLLRRFDHNVEFWQGMG